MGNDFNLKCQVETRRVLWLIALVLASVLIIQYFELPYRDSMLSLLSSGKSFFDANSRADRDAMFKEKQLIPRSRDENVTNFVLENAAKMNPSAEMANDVPRPVAEISPPLSYTVEDEGAASPSSLRFPPAPDSGVKHMIWTRNAGADISPSPSFAENITVLVWGENARIAPSPMNLDALLAPVISPSSDAKYKFSPQNVAADISPSASFGDNDTVLVLNENVALVPVISPSQSVSNGNVDIGLGATVVAYSPQTIGNENGTTWKPSPTEEHSSVANSPPPPPKEMPGRPLASVVSISEMNDMLIRSRVSSFMKSPVWPSAADQELLGARFQIENVAVVMDHPRLYAPVYRNLSMFTRSYEIMEQKLKVYIYKDGKRPVFHQPRLKGIYASEGWFMKLLKASNQFLTSNPGEAHLFYLPFSSQLLVDYVYVPDSHSFHDILEYLKNYLGTIKENYPFWNRTDGADHFLVACHDWAPFETKRLMANCIRALCNADVKEGFQLGKDVSLPETYIQSPQNPMKQIGGNPPSGRKILAFFAGKMHGYVRPILLKYWENKDPDMKIFGRMQAGNYVWHMKNSKYCICAKGYEVNSPRVVEAIIYGCVPVILSDNFVPPFFDVLNWESFAVFVLEKDIPNLKNILVSISERRYVVMQHRVEQVRQHFLWHNVPVKYDIFHMILHSVWYNRVLRSAPTPR
ncbi:probable glycosyltransferase At5g11130 [Sesamum indicum]|uniref:Probable glycosyltransferase At5g11130 n=1 Tax=Sesamum indicum TaxID=4182 RepID=A0A6I9U0Y0_SESIN|nr:probable glycosyltransferase At5g11130 [Sesamum indicum]